MVIESGSYLLLLYRVATQLSKEICRQDPYLDDILSTFIWIFQKQKFKYMNTF